MAEQQDEDPAHLGSIYPDPPLFWQDFTTTNIERFSTIKRLYAGQKGLDIVSITRLPDVPEDLANLNPPPEPEDGEWRVFSEIHRLDDKLQSLEAGGIQRLVTPVEVDRDGKHEDRALELKRLAKSMMLNFLEWVGVMGYNPVQGQDKIADLRTLLFNFHHILNEYRPHQAREQLITMMQEQLDNKHAETAAIRAVVDKAKSALEGLGSMAVPESVLADSVASNREKKGKSHWEREKGIWGSVESDLT